VYWKLTASIFRIRSKWQIPGELESTINWYKAVLIKDMPDTRDFTTTSPVKVIWGNQDIFLDVSLGRASLKYVNNEHKKFVEINGTHWISREMPEVVNKELDEWFNEIF
jgi:pimeloyl-ACP methyl ester carboxylesterase